MADAIQGEHEATFKFIEEVHSCPVEWDVLSVVYKDTKIKQKKLEELADKLGFVQTFPLISLPLGFVQTFQFPHRFLCLLFSPVYFSTCCSKPTYVFFVQ